MNYWNSIYEMPVYCWFKLMETGNYAFLLKDNLNKSARKIEFLYDDDLVNHWFDLQDEFVDEFGRHEKTLEILEMKRRIGLMKVAYLISGDKFKLTQIEINELKLKDKKGEEKEFNYNKEVGIIGTKLGRPLNLKEVTVHEYHSLKQSLTNG